MFHFCSKCQDHIRHDNLDKAKISFMAPDIHVQIRATIRVDTT